MAITLRKCALEGLESWLTHEAAIVADLSSQDIPRRLAALRRAAGRFRIARTMPTAHDIGRGRARFAPVLQILDNPRFRRVTPGDLVDTVGVLRHGLADAYRKSDLLSAATKFLWLLHREVAIIFDSQARTALRTPRADYRAYVDRWRQRYMASIDSIRSTCVDSCTVATALRRLRPNVAQSAVEAIMREDWFHMRVFDIHLWHAGRSAS
jgi:hypothetical protein